MSPHDPGQQHCCFLGFFCVIERYFRIRKAVNKRKHALIPRLHKKRSSQFWLEIIYVEMKYAVVISLFFNIPLWHVETPIFSYNVVRRARYWFFSGKKRDVGVEAGLTNVGKHSCATSILYIYDSCSFSCLTAGISRAGTLLPLTSCRFAKHTKGREWNDLHFQKK